MLIDDLIYIIYTDTDEVIHHLRNVSYENTKHLLVKASQNIEM